MQIQRDRSRLTFRARSSRRSGCLPMTLLVGILFGAVLASWDWLGERLSLITPQHTSGDLRAASQAFDRGDLDAASSYARQVWAAHPDQTEALTLLVRALIYRSYSDFDRDSDRDAALQIASQAVERWPGNPDIMAIHAFALQAAGRPMEAARTADTVLNRKPNHTLARIAMSLAYARVGSYEIALREGQIAAAASDWPMDAHRALAISLSDLGRYHEAAAAVDQAISHNSRLLVLHFERALYAMQVGDADAATAAYFRVLAFDPDNVKARLRMCELSSTLREYETAIRYCQEVTERAPAWADGWYYLGREYFLQGDFATAQQNLNRCTSLLVMQNVAIPERRFECWYLQGQAAEILGDCDGLLATYNEFRTMAASAALPQTWTYPPEGPSICLDSTTPPESNAHSGG
jgi:tetratricopeptide (TPR) repeat protein